MKSLILKDHEVREVLKSGKVCIVRPVKLVKGMFVCEKTRFYVTACEMKDEVGPFWHPHGGHPGEPLPNDRIQAACPIGQVGDRSKLFFEVVRLARDIRPRFLFLENVPAITVRGLDRVLLEFTTLGFDCRWTIVSAGEMGACHLRERWWLCAHANGQGFQESGSLQDEKSVHRGQKGDSALSVVQSDVWNQSPSDVYRMDDGISPKTHRIRALGNAVVPLQAREAFMRLTGLKSTSSQTGRKESENG